MPESSRGVARNRYTTDASFRRRNCVEPECLDVVREQDPDRPHRFDGPEAESEIGRLL
jgi:hypothetical protein